MKVKLTVLMLLVIIIATVSGVIMLGEREGIIRPVTPDITAMIGMIPWVGPWIFPPPQPPLQEQAALGKLQEENARVAQWEELRRTEAELKKAEDELNNQRQRLSQWEDELERRAQALTAREQEYNDRKKQYEQQIKFYLSMKPATAAKILAQQEDLLVVELFRRMPERNVAAIVGEMDPAVAATIMRKMNR